MLRAARRPYRIFTVPPPEPRARVQTARTLRTRSSVARLPFLSFPFFFSFSPAIFSTTDSSMRLRRGPASSGAAYGSERGCVPPETARVAVRVRYEGWAHAGRGGRVPYSLLGVLLRLRPPPFWRPTTFGRPLLILPVAFGRPSGVVAARSAAAFHSSDPVSAVFRTYIRLILVIIGREIITRQQRS